MVTEDEVYRSSTQFRLWNFTPERLAALRRKTNKLATESAEKAFKRQHESGDAAEQEVDYLTVEEESVVVDWYCTQLMAMVNSFQNSPFPQIVTATAVQYIRRFYLTNSPMSYSPMSIMTTALFLACKTESTHISVRRFVATLNPIKGLESLTADDILAPEYILTQGLRFCFDVRHPFRALKGAFVELQQLLNIARGDSVPEAWKFEKTKTGKPKNPSAIDLQRYILDKYQSPVKLSDRVEKAYAHARETLHKHAVVSDVYFLFTPSQVMWAALHLADAGLVADTLELRFRLPPPGAPAHERAAVMARRPIFDNVMVEIQECAEMLQEAAAKFEQAFGDEGKRIRKKLETCRNPEKLDLVSLNKAQKRDATENGKLDDQIAKKRKLEREAAEKDGQDLFGPAITK